MKEGLLEEFEQDCEAKADRLLHLAMKDKDRPTPPPSFESLVSSCQQATAKKDPRYEACFNSKLLDLASACALEKCSEAAAACLSGTCRVDVHGKR